VQSICRGLSGGLIHWALCLSTSCCVLLEGEVEGGMCAECAWHRVSGPSARRPPPPWINGKAARIRADSPSSLGFAPLSVRCATSSSAVSLSSATTILVSSRSLSDCYFISRVHAARKSVKISFPRLLIFACVAMSAAVAANKRKSW
jgi:hypothetical protein